MTLCSLIRLFSSIISFFVFNIPAFGFVVIVKSISILAFCIQYALDYLASLISQWLRYALWWMVTNAWWLIVQAWVSLGENVDKLQAFGAEIYDFIVVNAYVLKEWVLETAVPLIGEQAGYLCGNCTDVAQRNYKRAIDFIGEQLLN